MSGDWMKIELETPDKPEVMNIASRLNIDPDAVVGKLIRVWAWFDKHTENGNALRVTKTLVDRVAGVQNFADAMMIENWLVFDDTGIQLPKFDRHNGQTAKTRALTAKRAANHRSKSNGESN